MGCEYGIDLWIVWGNSRGNGNRGKNARCHLKKKIAHFKGIHGFTIEIYIFTFK